MHHHGHRPGMYPQGGPQPYGVPGMFPPGPQYGAPGMYAPGPQYGAPGMYPPGPQYGAPGMYAPGPQYGGTPGTFGQPYTGSYESHRHHHDEHHHHHQVEPVITHTNSYNHHHHHGGEDHRYQVEPVLTHTNSYNHHHHPHHAPERRGHSRHGRKYVAPHHRLKTSTIPTTTFTPPPSPSYTRNVRATNSGNTGVDLRPQCPPVYDQGQLGSCTANAIAFAYEFDERKQGKTVVGTPSRLFIYYNERAQEGTVNSDDGAAISDGVNGVHTIGVVSETKWPYDITKFKDKPHQSLFNEAKRHVTTNFRQVQGTLDQIQAALQQGYPVIFSGDVFESLESASTSQSGIVPLPTTSDKCLGGHAMAIVGYNSQHFIVRNSWGPKVGDGGYYYFPTEYITNSKYCSQFWVLCEVSD